jgi:hypothetical protein
VFSGTDATGFPDFAQPELARSREGRSRSASSMDRRAIAVRSVGIELRSRAPVGLAGLCPP